MSINCSQAEDLLGAYVLDALPEDETRRMDEHLESCTEHAAAAAELSKTRSLLPLAVDEAQPPPELRERIMHAIEAGPVADRPAATPIVDQQRSRQVRGLPRWTLRPIHGAIAAALVLALGLGGAVGYLLSQAGQPIAYNFQGAASSAPGATARLVYFKDRKQAVLTVSGLPRLAAGHVYEIWLIKGGVPVDEGVSTGPDGKVGVQLAADLSQFDQLAITIEPGEQQLPTTTPVLIGHLGAGST
jgi:anti-sigma-K factor RskA